MSLKVIGNVANVKWNSIFKNGEYISGKRTNMRNVTSDMSLLRRKRYSLPEIVMRKYSLRASWNTSRKRRTHRRRFGYDNDNNDRSFRSLSKSASIEYPDEYESTIFVSDHRTINETRDDYDGVLKDKSCQTDSVGTSVDNNNNNNNNFNNDNRKDGYKKKIKRKKKINRNKGKLKKKYIDNNSIERCRIDNNNDDTTIDDDNRLKSESIFLDLASISLHSVPITSTKSEVNNVPSEKNHRLSNNNNNLNLSSANCPKKNRNVADLNVIDNCNTRVTDDTMAVITANTTTTTNNNNNRKVFSASADLKEKNRNNVDFKVIDNRNNRNNRLMDGSINVINSKNDVTNLTSRENTIMSITPINDKTEIIDNSSGRNLNLTDGVIDLIDCAIRATPDENKGTTVDNTTIDDNNEFRNYSEYEDNINRNKGSLSINQYLDKKEIVKQSSLTISNIDDKYNDCILITNNDNNSNNNNNSNNYIAKEKIENISKGPSNLELSRVKRDSERENIQKNGIKELSNNDDVYQLIIVNNDKDERSMLSSPSNSEDISRKEVNNFLETEQYDKYEVVGKLRPIDSAGGKFDATTERRPNIKIETELNGNNESETGRQNANNENYDNNNGTNGRNEYEENNDNEVARQNERKNNNVKKINKSEKKHEENNESDNDNESNRRKENKSLTNAGQLEDNENNGNDKDKETSQRNEKYNRMGENKNSDNDNGNETNEQGRKSNDNESEKYRKIDQRSKCHPSLNDSFRRRIDIEENRKFTSTDYYWSSTDHNRSIFPITFQSESTLTYPTTGGAVTHRESHRVSIEITPPFKDRDIFTSSFDATADNDRYRPDNDVKTKARFDSNCFVPPQQPAASLSSLGVKNCRHPHILKIPVCYYKSGKSIIDRSIKDNDVSNESYYIRTNNNNNNNNNSLGNSSRTTILEKRPYYRGSYYSELPALNYKPERRSPAKKIEQLENLKSDVLSSSNLPTSIGCEKSDISIDRKIRQTSSEILSDSDISVADSLEDFQTNGLNKQIADFKRTDDNDNANNANNNNNNNNNNKNIISKTNPINDNKVINIHNKHDEKPVRGHVELDDLGNNYKKSSLKKSLSYFLPLNNTVDQNFIVRLPKRLKRNLQNRTKTLRKHTSCVTNDNDNNNKFNEKNKRLFEKNGKSGDKFNENIDQKIKQVLLEGLKMQRRQSQRECRNESSSITITSDNDDNDNSNNNDADNNISSTSNTCSITENRDKNRPKVNLPEKFENITLSTDTTIDQIQSKKEKTYDNVANTNNRYADENDIINNKNFKNEKLRLNNCGRRRRQQTSDSKLVQTDRNDDNDEFERKKTLCHHHHHYHHYRRDRLRRNFTEPLSSSRINCSNVVEYYELINLTNVDNTLPFERPLNLTRPRSQLIKPLSTVSNRKYGQFTYRLQESLKKPDNNDTITTDILQLNRIKRQPTSSYRRLTTHYDDSSTSGGSAVIPQQSQIKRSSVQNQNYRGKKIPDIINDNNNKSLSAFKSKLINYRSRTGSSSSNRKKTRVFRQKFESIPEEIGHSSTENVIEAKIRESENNAILDRRIDNDNNNNEPEKIAEFKDDMAIENALSEKERRYSPPTITEKSGAGVDNAITVDDNEHQTNVNKTDDVTTRITHKGREALLSKTDEKDKLITLSKGWINFYLLKNHSPERTPNKDTSSQNKDDETEVKQYTLHIHATPQTTEIENKSLNLPEIVKHDRNKGIYLLPGKNTLPTNDQVSSLYNHHLDITSCNAFVNDKEDPLKILPELRCKNTCKENITSEIYNDGESSFSKNYGTDVFDLYDTDLRSSNKFWNKSSECDINSHQTEVLTETTSTKCNFRSLKSDHSTAEGNKWSLVIKGKDGHRNSSEVKMQLSYKDRCDKITNPTEHVWTVSVQKDINDNNENDCNINKRQNYSPPDTVDESEIIINHPEKIKKKDIKSERNSRPNSSVIADCKLKPTYDTELLMKEVKTKLQNELSSQMKNQKLDIAVTGNTVTSSKKPRIPTLSERDLIRMKML